MFLFPDVLDPALFLEFFGGGADGFDWCVVRVVDVGDGEGVVLEDVFSEFVIALDGSTSIVGVGRRG